jgi:hypothetical protein
VGLFHHSIELLRAALRAATTKALYSFGLEDNFVAGYACFLFATDPCGDRVAYPITTTAYWLTA